MLVKEQIINIQILLMKTFISYIISKKCEILDYVRFLLKQSKFFTGSCNWARNQKQCCKKGLKVMGTSAELNFFFFLILRVKKTKNKQKKQKPQIPKKKFRNYWNCQYFIQGHANKYMKSKIALWVFSCH